MGGRGIQVQLLFFRKAVTVPGEGRFDWAKACHFSLFSFGLPSPVSRRRCFSLFLFPLTHQVLMANPQSTWLLAPNWASTLSLQSWSFLLQVKTEKVERKTWWTLFPPSVPACLQPGDRWHSPFVWKLCFFFLFLTYYTRFY